MFLQYLKEFARRIMAAVYSILKAFAVLIENATTAPEGLKLW
jgi:hypothetical protein